MQPALSPLPPQPTRSCHTAYHDPYPHQLIRSCHTTCPDPIPPRPRRSPLSASHDPNHLQHTRSCHTACLKHVSPQPTRSCHSPFLKPSPILASRFCQSADGSGRSIPTMRFLNINTIFSLSESVCHASSNFLISFGSSVMMLSTPISIMDRALLRLLTVQTWICIPRR